MLLRLKINNFILIDTLEINFNPGFTVITGETGSGKSIIIDGLLALFGMRTNIEMIRHGVNQAILEAEFAISNSKIITWLQENDFIEDNETLFCKRVLDVKGKNKVYINGYIASVSQIKQLADMLLDIHTQHASITLLKPDIQRALIDEYANITDKVMQLEKLYIQQANLKQQIDELLVNNNIKAQRQEFLINKCHDLESISAIVTKWDEINVLHKQLVNANHVIQELDFLHQNIDGESNSFNSLINKLQYRMQKLVLLVPQTQKILTNLEQISFNLNEIIRDATLINHSITNDENTLQELEESIEEVFRITRKYKLSPNEVLENLIATRNELDLLSNSNNMQLLQEQYDLINTQYIQLASVITNIRAATSFELSKQITTLLHKLSLNGEFDIRLIKSELPLKYGLENIEYNVSFNNGLKLKPLAKIASGGELSRCALALYLLLSLKSAPEVIIFDEIDVGIGGKIAAMVGQLLRELGSAKQVICITHQPQTASFAHSHYVVNKLQTSKYPIISVDMLDDDLRVTELARMLSGIAITEATIKHAKELLNVALS